MMDGRHAATAEDDELVLRHAVRAYADACAFEANGECERAVGLYRRAFSLERALDSDEDGWPGWLSAAAERHERASDAPIAPLLGPTRHVELAPPVPNAGADVIAQLRRSSYACVDGFVSAELAAAAGAEIRRAHAAGAMAPGEVGGDASAARVAARRRSDWVSHVGAESDGWAAVREACAAVEGLAAALRPALALGGASRPMATRYADGARYAMHFDNTCHDGAGPAARAAGAPCPNERRLTCVLYATLDWRPGDGGELRLFRANRTGCPHERHALVRAELAPVAGRLVVFFSDFRCPHEVLPAWRERLAVTVWYGRAGGGSDAGAAAVLDH